MLDTVTLRVAFGLVASCVLVLFYSATYRVTRSSYCAWWCVALSLFIVGASLYLFDGTDLQVVANPLGNAVTTAGAAAVWAGSCALRGLGQVRWSTFGVGPVAVLAASLADDPADDVWSGGAVFLSAMAVLLGAASRELRLYSGELRGDSPVRASVASDRQYAGAVTAMQWMSLALAVFYLGRAGTFVVVGSEHRLFETAFGSQATTLVTLSMLVVVTYTMAIVTHGHQTEELRDRATRDGLTGLLNRSELLDRLASALQEGEATAVLIADLDGFKTLNDREGHAAGDRALAAFAAAAEAAVGPGDTVGRLGGDEFAVVVTDPGRADQVADRIRRELHQWLTDTGTASAGPDLTVSIGISTGRPGAEVAELLHQADVALYQAKAAGRDRAVQYDGAPTPPLPPGRRRNRRS